MFGSGGKKPRLLTAKAQAQRRAISSAMKLVLNVLLELFCRMVAGFHLTGCGPRRQKAS